MTGFKTIFLWLFSVADLSCLAFWPPIQIIAIVLLGAFLLSLAIAVTLDRFESRRRYSPRIIRHP